MTFCLLKERCLYKLLFFIFTFATRTYIHNNQMSIENQLSDLLRLTGHTVIPGIGRFQLEYRPAVIDYIQKHISTPGKFVNFHFNESLLINDIPDAQCAEIEKSLWESAGINWQERLNNKETILLPNVGSVYKDFRGEIHFIPSNVNYDDASYGLRQLNIEPVIRKSEVAPVAPVVPKPVSRPKSNFQFADTLFSVLIGFTLIAISYGVWYAMSSKQISQPASRFPIAESTLEDQKNIEDILDYDAKWSVPGYYGEDSVASDSVSEDVASNDDQDTAVLNEVEVPKPAVPVASGKPKTNPAIKETNIRMRNAVKATPTDLSCMISVGSFSNDANAKSLLKKLSAKGYHTTIKINETNNMSRVVVMCTCDEAVLNATLARLKDGYNAGAYIVQ